MNPVGLYCCPQLIKSDSANIQNRIGMGLQSTNGKHNLADLTQDTSARFFLHIAGASPCNKDGKYKGCIKVDSQTKTRNETSSQTFENFSACENMHGLAHSIQP